MNIVEKRTLIENNNSRNDISTKVAFGLKVFYSLQKEGIISKNIKLSDPLPKTYNSELIEDTILEKNVNSYSERFKVSLLGKKQPKTYGDLFQTLIGDIDSNKKFDIDIDILNKSGVLNRSVKKEELINIILNSQITQIEPYYIKTEDNIYISKTEIQKAMIGIQLYMLDKMVNKKNGNIEKELKSEQIWGHVVSNLAEWIKIPMNWYERDWRKSEINKKGVDSMYSLLCRIDEYKKLNIQPPKDIDINPNKYLR